MTNEEIHRLLMPDVESHVAWEAIDALLTRGIDSMRLCKAVELVMETDKDRFVHLSWPATVLHILVEASDV